MKLIDGKFVASEIKKEIAKETAKTLDKGLNPPHLVAILVGDDPASQTYVASKERACKDVGFISSVYKHSEKITENELI